ncbi:MAG TPA: PASTA domain-containing protein [Gaiellaceae bacterium]|nr:PASTA domain-containing protein [Gaiellaceae bacterium]
MTRLVAFLPRLVALTVVWLLLTAAITFAAGERLQSSPAPQAQTAPAVTTTPLTVLVVPDVRHQAYVFAKGTLEDAGFAWKVTGSVPGYAANVVAAQVPAPGTRVIDTGAPTIEVQLAKGSTGVQGDPENSSPFSGTKLTLADVLPAAAPAQAPAAAKTTPTVPATRAAPTKTTAAARKAASAAKTTAPNPRPAAFTGAGTRPEPQDELPLPDRALKLQRWLATRPKPTDGNVRYWLYQHAWIVAGARAGWWHGDAALRTLMEVDHRVFQLWGIGARSLEVAKAALAEVEARSS